jgi:type II secretory pathway pseudopilin PulG
MRCRSSRSVTFSVRTTRDDDRDPARSNLEYATDDDSDRLPASGGFTLIELLVVIAIIEYRQMPDDASP